MQIDFSVWTDKDLMRHYQFHVRIRSARAQEFHAELQRRKGQRKGNGE